MTVGYMTKRDSMKATPLMTWFGGAAHQELILKERTINLQKRAQNHAIKGKKESVKAVAHVMREGF